MKFRFVARCAEQSLPLEVDLDYQPGPQAHRARRVAVGYLLAALELNEASVDASDPNMVIVKTSQGNWIIGEGKGERAKRGAV